MGTLAHNLDSRRDSIRAEYPGMTVYWASDPEHQARESDHNEDSRGIVHAIDAMTYTDKAKGNVIVQWALSDPDDLEYVIFNRKIYSRSSGFDEDDYTGSNPHEDHVHLSGKHGSTGYSSATGTGYDTAAEAMTPEGIDAMTDAQAYVQHVVNYRVDGLVHNRDEIEVPDFDAPGGSNYNGFTEINELAQAIRELTALVQSIVDGGGSAGGGGSLVAHTHPVGSTGPAESSA